jgi:hypothetical protein
MKIDPFILIVAALMILAMAFTVIYGKKFSRHGYGLHKPVELQILHPYFA